MARTKMCSRLTTGQLQGNEQRPYATKALMKAMSAPRPKPLPSPTKIKKKKLGQSKRNALVLNQYKKLIHGYQPDDLRGFIPFTRNIRLIMGNLVPHIPYKIQLKALMALKIAAVDFLVKIFQSLALLATACQRVTVMKKDLLHLAFVLKAWNTPDSKYFDKLMMPNTRISSYPAIGEVRKIVKESYGKGDPGRALVFIEKEKIKPKKKKD